MNRTIISRFSITLLCLLIVGCSIPLQRSPEPAQEQTGAESAEKQERRVALEGTNAESADEDATTDDSASSATESPQIAAAPTVVPEVANQAAASSGPADSANVVAEEESAAEGSTTDGSTTDGSTEGMSAEVLDLAALDRTFLETIDAASAEFGQIDEHRFVEVTDGRGIVWQGEALIGDGSMIVLMQPMQSGGQMAVRVVFDAAAEVASPEFESTLAELLSTVEIGLPDSDSFGPPDAEIQFVRARETAASVWSFDVRLNHPDTGWEDYTDGWHVETLDGEILAVRILLHPHVGEMPFTRGQGGIAIPAGVTEVQIRSHDLVSGYGQETVVVPIGESGSGEKYEVSR